MKIYIRNYEVMISEYRPTHKPARKATECRDSGLTALKGDFIIVFRNVILHSYGWELNCYYAILHSSTRELRALPYSSHIVTNEHDSLAWLGGAEITELHLGPRK
jgi:hypothetical protein